MNPAWAADAATARIRCEDRSQRIHQVKIIDISVIISTRNRADSLRRTLEGLRAQSTKGFRWEAVVVNNGSDDQTGTLLKEAASWMRLTPVWVATAGQNRGRNAALEHAHGKLLVFSDDDVLPESHWLERLWKASLNWPHDRVFGGRVIPKYPPVVPEWIADARFDYRSTAFAEFHPADAEGPVKEEPFGGNFAIRAEVMQGIRFTENLGPAGRRYAMGGETEFLRRLASEGCRFIYVPTAVVEHVIRPDQLSMGWLLNRAYCSGRGLARQFPMPVNRTVAGIPVYMLRQLPWLWFRYWWCRLVRRDVLQVWKTGRELYEFMGRMREHKLMLEDGTLRRGALRVRAESPFGAQSNG